MTEPIDQATKDLIEKEARVFASRWAPIDPRRADAFDSYIAAATLWAEKLKQEDQATIQAIDALTKQIAELMERLKQERNKVIEYHSLLESILRLKTILTYEENIPPEHEGEAIAINNLFYKIERTLKDKSHEAKTKDSQKPY